MTNVAYRYVNMVVVIFLCIYELHNRCFLLFQNSFKLIRHWVLRSILVAILGFAFAAIDSQQVAAQNTGCTVAATVADCLDVPIDGLAYDTASGIKTINVGDGTPGTADINDTVTGIQLTETGVNGGGGLGVEFTNTVDIDEDDDPGTADVTVVADSDNNPVLIAGEYVIETGPDAFSIGGIAFTGEQVADFVSDVEFGNTVEVDDDGDGGTADVTVVADSDDVPILVAGEYVIQTGPETFTIDGVAYTAEEVAELVATNTDDSGGTISGSLTVNNNTGPAPVGSGAPINTSNAGGIIVASTGGRGGNGGCTTVLFATWCGGGDQGGNSGSVAVNSNGVITVDGAGDGLNGITAISHGGTGGNGGGSFGVFSSKAGSGGTGGTGGAISVNLGASSNITTHADGGHGIFALSTGGDGGSGGSPSGALALGDKGGKGGDAGTVDVDNEGLVTTTGAAAHGIYASSIGAGAGSGSDAGGIIAIGGAGGLASLGANVTVDNSGLITTSNDDSFGIFAQSIGGGGGDGGSSGGLFSVGGRGNSGGNAGDVEVSNSGEVSTGGALGDDGDYAVAVFLQSVGGGGGNGGNAFAAGGSATVAIGGNGAVGGDGGGVAYNPLSDPLDAGLLTAVTITTNGEGSHGIQAQSVGGGGGNGGFAFSGSLSNSGFGAGIALGGSGAAGGDGGAVLVNKNGTITTVGDQAIGILAQSVGGGGGNGGVAGTVSSGAGAIGVSLGGAAADGGLGGTVIVTNFDAIATAGNNASGIFAQSVGGGGGNGGAAISGTGGVVSASVSLGGSAGAGGSSDAVQVNNFGSIDTGQDVDLDNEFGNLSYGIFAQSVGGGGGNGGFALSGSVGIECCGLPGGAAAISVGGTGGGGGEGGSVTVDNGGNIVSRGLGAHAIFAQSVGGGGGNGGFAGSVALTVGSGASLGMAVGGSGGAAGDAGIVNVSSNALSISTEAVGADGIHAQSVGGAGGDGGFAFAGALGFGEGKNVNATVAIGGSGGGGGISKTVTVDNQSAITTLGDHSKGVFAQSVGGGGGNGGLAISGSIGVSGSTGNFGVSVGGGGGTGGEGGVVVIGNNKIIQTSGDEAIGILGQSVGGAGGIGGLSMTALLTSATGDQASVGVSVGGDGGTGNFGNEVAITNELGGNILTTGLGSHGIFGQSVGGSGGIGGASIVAQLGIAGGTPEQASMTLNDAISIGGDGGTGGDAAKVHINNAGVIEVQGETATGVFAQSVGGGGGNGGGSLVAIGLLTNNDNAANRVVARSVTIGGSGGAAGNGGEVIVDNDGAITTTESSGYGVFAQSVGGGGGIGGRSNSLRMIVGTSTTTPPDQPDITSKPNNLDLSVAIGGTGGAAGDGMAVTVKNTGIVETFGETADGIYAQSIGGGGGNGGNGALGSTGLIPIPAELLLKKSGQVGFFRTWDVAVGGDQGASGDGGVVYVESAEYITTHGGNSNGIFAQSVGGGGGVGGKASIGAAGKIGIGGQGGAAGNGMRVDIDLIEGAVIETFGVASNGIFAQSVGGGGGVAGNVDRALARFGVNNGTGLAIATGGGDGGDGGVVDVEIDGTIVTHGDSSSGIFSQSVGGGGGLLGELGNETGLLSNLNWRVGSNGDAGNADEVKIDLAGNIFTAGNNANGIFAQSSTGSGTSGQVNVNIQGMVLTSEILDATADGAIDDPLRGLSSVGIMVQSVANTNSDNGDITVNIAGTDSVVRGGRSEGEEYIGVGVYFIDGNTNALTNEGLLTTVNGVDAGFAILAQGSDETHTGGNEEISNTGTVTGSFDLGLGVNSFTNELGSLLNTGQFAFVGAANSLTNKGRIAPGGDLRVMTTNVLGVFEQTEDGTYGVDMDLALTTLAPVLPLEPAEADVLLSDDTIIFDGFVDLDLLNRGNALPGAHIALLARTSGALTVDDALTLVAPASAVASYELAKTATELSLNYGIDFSAAGMNSNQSAIGEYINNFQTAFYLGDGDSTAMEPVIEALFNLPDLEVYSSALDQLSPETYVANRISSLFGAMNFENSLLSCRAYDGSYKFNAEGECVWASVGGGETTRDATSDNLAYRSTNRTFRTGGQKIVSEHLRAGLGFSYETLNNSFDDFSQSSGNRLQVGAALKGVYGGTTIAGTLTGGIDMYDVTRFVNLANGPSYVLDSTQNIAYVSAHSRISHTFGHDMAYLRPYFDAGVSQVYAGGFTERGNSPIALEVASSTQTIVTMEVAMEIGGEFRTGERAALRPFASVGVIALPIGANPEVSAKFTGAPASVDGFTVFGEVDDVLLDIELGFDVISQNGLSFRALANSQLGETTKYYGGSLKFVASF